MLRRVRSAGDRLADRVSERIASRVGDRLVGRGVRAVSPAPWFSAADGERSRLDERAMRAVLAAVLSADATFLDVGAHEGKVLQDAVRLAPNGSHVAWEPLPHLARALRDRFPAVEVREAALADRAGEAQFVHVLDQSGQSGLRDRAFPGDPRRETLTVQLERLDDALDPGLEPALVKVDVEGGELGVFRGGRETIARHRPCILFEHGVGGAEYFGAAPEEVWDLLCDDCALRVFDLDGEGPYSRDQFVDAMALRARWNWLARA
jgi:FkbM family methyltransferase